MIHEKETMIENIGPNAFKIITILIGFLAVLIGWIGKRNTNEIKEHGARINFLERQTVSEEKHDRELSRVYDTIAKLSDKVDYSVSRFEDEHEKTREILVKSNIEIISAVRELKNG